MTRIIAGAAGSLPLAVPSAGTRPTSDRVRESLFAALDAQGVVAGAHVLDGYAGSGALGLEAVSRGASAADLVDNAAGAVSVLRRNIATVLRAVPAARAAAHRGTVEAFLRSRRDGTPYDLVFLDPPYAVSEAELTETLQALLPHLADDAVVIVERASRSGAPELPDDLVQTRDRRYGDTTLWWLARA